MSRCRGVRRVGGLDVHRRRVLLFRHVVHHRVRRPGSRQIVPGNRHAERSAPVGRVLRLPAVRPGADRHVVLPGPGRGGVQVPARGPLRGTSEAAAPDEHPTVRPITDNGLHVRPPYINLIIMLYAQIHVVPHFMHVRPPAGQQNRGFEICLTFCKIKNNAYRDAVGKYYNTPSSNCQNFD